MLLFPSALTMSLRIRTRKAMMEGFARCDTQKVWLILQKPQMKA